MIVVLLFAGFLFKIWSEPFFLFYFLVSFTLKKLPKLTLPNNDYKWMKQMRPKKPLLSVAQKPWREKGPLDPFGELIPWRTWLIKLSNWSCFLKTANASCTRIECQLPHTGIIFNKQWIWFFTCHRYYFMEH